ncbi:uncharacterized protein K452DRAFT_298253 [Aplosporella prunicola CBS 121167]|uniref:F-box domain-containing protein n=1 Tax=Aplosporella prunicola CBS 121167 TaxID=1176127 RepID=A0A6A6BD70_9PEZI|nr:uncharacterized protein K452DRAFT_298253 [Aplosporella prunicola CBS 121167]KAF2141538.1 hypothetical protein K452DRAFT_298253 [Aplosporella prunicola CBS 121167]
MASFSDLPVELVAHILSFIPLPGHLAQVSLVCRALEKVTQRFLYHSFVTAEYNLHYRRFSRRIRPFFRTILLRPDLARHVRAVAIESWPTSSFDDAPIPEHALSLCRDAVARLDWPTADLKAQWIRRLTEKDPRHQDAEVALLLAMLPNLRELSLEDVWEKPKLTIAVLRAAAANTQDASRPLQRLEYLSADSDDPKHGWHDFTYCDVFFALPRVTTLEWVRPNPVRLPPGLLKPAMSSITALRLHGAQMRASRLLEIVRACRALTTFAYTYDSLVPGDNFLPRDAADALLQWHGNTLEHLTLDLNEDALKGLWQHSPPNRLYLGDLTGFTRLKTLRCGQQSLLGLLHAPYTGFGLGRGRVAAPSEVRAVPCVPPLSDLLPQSLEALELRYCDMRCVPDVVLLLGKAENGLGFWSLREVRVLCAEESTRKKGVQHMVVLEELEKLSEDDGRKVVLDVRYEGREARDKRRFPVDSVNVWRGSRIRYPRWERSGV